VAFYVGIYVAALLTTLRFFMSQLLGGMDSRRARVLGAEEHCRRHRGLPESNRYGECSLMADAKSRPLAAHLECSPPFHRRN
jgi:hypothetical protein